MEATNQYFVYGTLKRGLRNSHVWPANPMAVVQGWIRGQLFGRPEYPALKIGNDRVMGELWRFETKHIGQVADALDVLEGTNDNGPNDLYHRVIADVFDMSGQSLGSASTYRYVGNPIRDGFERITQDSDGYVRWPAAS